MPEAMLDDSQVLERTIDERPVQLRRWSLWLSVAALALALLTFHAFDPGFVSVDTLTQYQQATGETPINDWHPPVLTLLWRALMNVSGQTSSMLALQLTVYWGSLLTIALVLLRRSRSWIWACAPLAVGLVPSLLTFAGVIWKDVHLALALLATVALAMAASEFSLRRPLRWALIALSVVLLTYAALVRKNALVALPPIFYVLYLSFTEGSTRRPRFLAGLVVAVALVAGMAQLAITTVVKPVQGHQLASIAVDDITHVSTAADIRGSALSADVQSRLLKAKGVCAKRHILSDRYLRCYDSSPGGPIPVPNAAQLQAAWPGLMLRHPVAYAKYRAEVFGKLLIQPRRFWYHGVIKNSEGLRLENRGTYELLRRYIVDVGVGWFGFLFSGVTCSLGALYLTFRRLRGQHGILVRCLGLSALLYILGYLPFAPYNDYRYYYWSSFAVVIGLMLALHDRFAMGATPPPRPAKERIVIRM
jgi:hypothetical protein